MSFGTPIIFRARCPFLLVFSLLSQQNDSLAVIRIEHYGNMGVCYIAKNSSILDGGRWQKLKSFATKLMLKRSKGYLGMDNTHGPLKRRFYTCFQNSEKIH